MVLVSCDKFSANTKTISWGHKNIIIANQVISLQESVDDISVDSEPEIDGGKRYDAVHRSIHKRSDSQASLEDPGNAVRGL